MKALLLGGAVLLCLSAGVEPRSVDFTRARSRVRPVRPIGYRTVRVYSSSGQVSAAPEPVAKSLLKADYKIVTELPKPKAGFYLNRQFQKPAAAKSSRTLASDDTISGLPQPKEGFFLNRQFQQGYEPRAPQGKTQKIVEDNGRYWKVAELPELDESFYLNRQFQNKPSLPKKVSPDSEKNKEVFLLRKNTEEPRTESPVSFVTLEKRIGTVVDETVPLPQQQRPRSEVSFYDVFSQTDSKPATSFSRRPSASRPPTPVPQQAIEPVRKESQRGGTSSRRTHIVSALNRPRVDQKPSSEEAFTCHGKPYGYYPDITSGCKNYHICNPVRFSGNFVQYYKYSFSCGSGMLWDNAANSCVPAALASPCS